MSDLLKQSIADAKAVRETALANAKSFLEENFASSMKEMFADKLAEDMESDVAEDIGTSEIGGDEGNMASDQDPVEPSEISSETSTDTSGDSTEVVEGECADEDAAEDAAEEIDEEASLTKEELDAILKELSEDAEEAAEEVVDAEADAVSDEEIVADEIDEEIDLDEVLAELEGDIAETYHEEEDVEEAVSEEAVSEETVAEETVAEETVAEEAVSEETVAEEADVELEEEVNIEEMAHAIVTMNEENDSLKSTLSEHENTIKYLKKVLSETNLLNAKLLYTNKLFKGRRLSEDQKMKVINTFDLTKSIREVKLAYSVLAESFNSGASVASKKTNATAQAITEGLASKPVKSTKPNLIVETKVSDMASRFQKLAGIVK